MRRAEPRAKIHRVLGGGVLVLAAGACSADPPQLPVVDTTATDGASSGATGGSSTSGPASGTTSSATGGTADGSTGPDPSSSGGPPTPCPATQGFCFVPVVSTDVLVDTVADGHLGDVDGDGVPDFVFAHVDDPGVAWASGLGDGTFAMAQSISLASAGAVRRIALADFDADGALDLIVGYSGPDISAVATYLHTPTDGFTLADGETEAFGLITGIVAADLDADGAPDFVVVGDGGYLGAFPVDDAGIFEPSYSAMTGSMHSDIVTGDLDSDALADFAVVAESSDAVSTWRTDMTGALQPAKTVEVSAPTAAALADVDGDGLPDVVASTRATGSIVVAFGEGGGQLQDAQDFAGLPTQTDLGVGDFDGDGTEDIVVVDGAAQTLAFIRGGDLSGPRALFEDLPHTVGRLVVGDVNGDGIPDVVMWSMETTGLVALVSNPDD